MHLIDAARYDYCNAPANLQGLCFKEFAARMSRQWTGRCHEGRLSAMAQAVPAREKLESVLRLTCQLNSARQLDALLDLLTEEAARLLGADRASIFLLSQDARWLESKVALGSPQRIRLDAAKGIAGAVVASGEPIVVADAYSDPRFYQVVDQSTGYHTQSLLAVPLLDLDGSRVGVLEILNKTAGAFDNEDLAVAQALAAQAAVGIRTARMIDEIERAKAGLESENQNLRREIGARLPGRTIVGAHPKLEELRRMVERVAAVDVTVLITGESGTGKDLVARTLHYSSERAAAPFIALNCAALPETLVEAELFGMEKGVATGVDRRAGKFEAANGGSLFLDEIGDLSLTAQAKILRVLQERCVERVGGRKEIPVDVRLIAATNKNLESMIARGEFREDLYYRLNVVRLQTPALREIASDIPAIAMQLLDRAAREMQRPAPVFDAEALQMLAAHRWPGNVRQLENEMRRAVALARDGRVRAEDLSPEVRGVPATLAEPARPRRLPLTEEIEQLEQQRIREALVRCRYNQLRTAKDLGLSRQGLLNKLKRYGIAARQEEGQPE